MPSSTARQCFPRLLAVVMVLAAACSSDGLTGPSGANAGRALAAVAAGSCTPYDYSGGSSAYSPDKQGWSLDFEEQFTDPALPAWNRWYGGAWNEEEQLYLPANVTVDPAGVLTIRAEAAPGGVTGPANPYDATQKLFYYTSGRIESRTLFALSRTRTRKLIAARIQFSDGGGMWPAFWSYGDPWPTKGEIDILEARGLQASPGYDQDTYQSAYWYGRRQGVNLVTTAPVTFATGASLTSCWHVYEVIWEKNQLSFRFDGNTMERVISGGYIPSMFGKQQKLTLNLAVGGLFFGSPYVVEPGSLKVDWVRVYSQR